MKINKSNIILILILVAVVGLMAYATIRYNNAVEKEAEYKKEKAWKQKFHEKWEREHTQADSFDFAEQFAKDTFLKNGDVEYCSEGLCLVYSWWEVRGNRNKFKFRKYMI